METRESVIEKLAKVTELHIADGKHLCNFGNFTIEIDEYGITVGLKNTVGLFIVKGYGSFTLRVRSKEILIAEDDYNAIYVRR